MKKTGRRWISLALALCMALSVLPTAAAADFGDVAATAWYYDAVQYVTERGFFEGTGAGAFSPDAPMNRAMFVTVLSRLEGAVLSDEVSPFDDVASGAWYAGEVAWAVENGLANGTGSGAFSPERSVTRQEMAAFMARYIGYYTDKHQVTLNGTGFVKPFADEGKIASWAADAVALCRMYGLIDGYSDGSFGPEDTATRAQVAAVIRRLAALLEGASPIAQEEPAKTETQTARRTESSGKSSSGSSSGGSSDSGSDSKTDPEPEPEPTPAEKTTSDRTASSADEFKAAAEAEADCVTATVTEENTLSVYDDVTITNNSATELTLDLGSAMLGDLTVNAGTAGTITIKGDGATVASLTVYAPLATVQNFVTVNGTVTVKAVSGSTFDNFAATGTIIMNGQGAVNDQQKKPAPVVIDVPVGTQVAVRGNSAQISVVSDGAKLTVATEVAPKVDSTAQTVEVIVNTTEPVTVAGTVDTVTAAVSAPTLKVDGTVKTVDTASASEIKVEGTGEIGTVNSGSAAVVVESAKLTVETVAATDGGSLKAPANTVSEVRASGSVTLDAPVATVTAASDTVLTLGGSASVTTVEAEGSLTLEGTGTVSSVDVQTDNAQIAVSESASVTVAQVTTTAETTQNISVSGLSEPITVRTKAAKPENVKAAAPVTLDGNGTITGVDAAMEYCSLSDDRGWLEIAETALSLPSGTYQVRVKEQGTKLASEAVSVTIPATVGVSSGTVQGTLHVGQTLTASANADATGTISYEWKLGDTTCGTAQTLTLADEYAGQSISVTMSNYGGAASYTKTVGTVIVDKTALAKLLGKAGEIQKGVSVKDEEASAVAEGIVFVPTEQSDALTKAIAAANAANVNTANTQTVSAAESGLRTAIAAYTAAKKTGTNNEVQTLQNDLSALLSAAPQVVMTAEAAEYVTPGTQWTTAAAKTAYTTAWTTANGKTASTDAETLRQAISDLNAAITAYNKAIQLGAQLDGSALTAAVTAAEQNAASVTVSTDGTDVLPSATWVLQTVLGDYTGAITAAKNVTATVQNDYTAALATLNRRTENFNSAKAAGSKVVAAHIHTFTYITDWTALTSARTCACGESQPISGIYYVNSAADLAAFRDAVNAGTDFAGSTVQLTANLTLTGEWTPIGNGARSGGSCTGAAFRGTFDGGWKSITGLAVTTAASEDHAIGLFGVVDGGTVRNLTLSVSVNAASSELAGGAVGFLTGGGTVQSVTVNGQISAKKGVGGIVGRLTYNGTIADCTNHAVITSAKGNVGGIVGAAYYTTPGQSMTISGCSNDGSITSSAGYSGGIVGLSSAAVTDCTNTAAVTGSATGVGGIVGEQKTFGQVTGCENSGSVTNNDSSAYGTGGIIGWLRYHGTGENASYGASAVISVTGNTNSASVRGGHDAGGIIGTLYNSAVVTGNHSTAASLVGTEFAAGIVGNWQTTETPAAAEPAKNTLVFTDNTARTPMSAIQANCTAELIYTNGNGAAEVNGVWYSTLAAAIAASQSGDTITLRDDLAETDAKAAAIKYDLTGRTLDLNGHTYSQNNYAHVFYGTGGTIKNGTIVCLNGGYANGTNGSYALFIGSNDVAKTEGFTVENVAFTGGINVYQNASGVTLKNLTVHGTRYYAVWAGENTSVTIKSGTYSSDSSDAGNSVLNAGSDNGDYSGQSLITVEGGTFTCKDGQKIMGTAASTGALTITGGTFSSDPGAYAATGYTAVQAEDGSSWTVRQRTWRDYPEDGTVMPAGVEIVDTGSTDGTSFVITLKDEEAFLYFTQVFDVEKAYEARKAAGEAGTIEKYPSEKNCTNLNMWYMTSGITIKLGCEVDLKGMTVSTAKLVRGYGPVFDGCGNTIKNGKIEATSGYAGFFYGNITVRNVTFDRFTVSANGCDGAAVVYGCVRGAQGVYAPPRESLAIEKVYVTNSTVTGAKYTGAIVGWGNGNIDVIDCKVEKTVVCGQYKVGGAVGFICGCDASDYSLQFTGNVLTDVTVKGENIWPGKDKDGFKLGKIVGNWCVPNGACKNNTFTGTTDATENIGQKNSVVSLDEG